MAYDPINPRETSPVSVSTRPASDIHTYNPTRPRGTTGRAPAPKKPGRSFTDFLWNAGMIGTGAWPLADVLPTKYQPMSMRLLGKMARSVKPNTGHPVSQPPPNEYLAISKRKSSKKSNQNPSLIIPRS